ncbi:MAG: family 1 glycosylhydrolase, partial [Polyangiales bacterium]
MTAHSFASSAAFVLCGLGWLGCSSSDDPGPAAGDSSVGDSSIDVAEAAPDSSEAGIDTRPTKGVFPVGFLWGAGTAGFQVESNPAVSSDWGVWETLTAKVKNADKATGGPDQYAHFADDLALAKAMGLGAFRFSIEWARIEPTQGTFDEAAIAHYQALIAACKASGLKPIVTLWHFVNPKWVLDPTPGTSLGGWAQKATADAFVSFVTRVVPRFEADVDFWITLNEPMIAITNGYFFAAWPPGGSFDEAGAIAAHNNMIDAHVRSYDAIHAIYAAKSKPVTVTIASHWVAFDPKTPSDAEATKGVSHLINEAFLDAVVNGDVDPGLDGKITHRDDYAHHLDLVGLNFYQHQVVTSVKIGIVPGLNEVDPAAKLKSDLGWELYPQGMGRALDDLSARYKLPIVVTENGVADAADKYRSWYIVTHLQEVQKAIARGIDVRGYLHWALIDNFEWAEGL